MRLKTLAFLLLLAACGGGGAPQGGGGATVSSQGGGGDPRVAKALFAAVDLPSPGPSSPIGGYSRGCQAGAVQLPETGPTWQAMRLSRNRNWGQPVLVDFLQDLSRQAAQLPGWDGIYVGDMSQPRGGPMPAGHASHQTGLDADVWMRPAGDLGLSRAAREEVSSIDYQRAGGAYVNESWTPAHEALIRAAASDPRVARIFVFAGAKVEMCRNATGDRSWLRKVRPWGGHNTHFHVRLDCPPGALDCVEQDPVPAGDGCAEAEAWVANLLSPSPAEPAAEPAEPAEPRRDLTMGDLPAQCAAVLATP